MARPASLILAACLLSAYPVPGQRAAPSAVGTIRPYAHRSPTVDNPSPERLLVHEHVVHFPRATFVSLEFADVHLGPDSVLEIRSLADGDRQAFTHETWRSHGPHSGRFNGDAVLVRLYAGAGTSRNRFTIRSAAVGDRPTGPANACRNDCNVPDKRVPVVNPPRVARMMWRDSKTKQIFCFCTAFLISETNAFATAGHCLNMIKHLMPQRAVWVEFNVPRSDRNGVCRPAKIVDQYLAEGAADSFAWEMVPLDPDIPDWGVFQTKVNVQTGRHAGKVQRKFFEWTLSKGPGIRFTGYGCSSLDPTLRSFSQTGTGRLRRWSASSPDDLLMTSASFRPGNSGSPVIDAISDKAIGVFWGWVRIGSTCYSIATPIGYERFWNAVRRIAFPGPDEIQGRRPWFGRSVDIAHSLTISKSEFANPLVAIGAPGTGAKARSAVSIYNRFAGPHWTEEAMLTNGQRGSQFGWAVAISRGNGRLEGDRVVVGAPELGSSSLFRRGGAYIYERIDHYGPKWSLEKMIPGPADTINFGRSAAIGANSSNYLIAIGAQRTRQQPGAVHVYRLTTSGWTQEAVKRRFRRPWGDGGFSWSLALDDELQNERLLVGEPFTASYNTPGEALVYRRVQGVWRKMAKLVPKGASVRPDHAQAGWSVAIDGDVAVLGAHHDVVNGVRSGAAYVFRLKSKTATSEVWQQEARLALANPKGFEQFGESVEVSGDTIAVGAWSYVSPSTRKRTGAVLLYRHTNGRWELFHTFVPKAALNSSAALGNAVALAGGHLVASAPGIRKAYVHSVRYTMSGYGAPCGQAEIGGRVVTDRSERQVRVTATGPANALGLWIIGKTELNVPIDPTRGCVLLTDVLLHQPFRTDAKGAAPDLFFRLPTLQAVNANFQAGMLQAGKLHLSNAMALRMSKL